jgi:phosphoribosylformylglycinamidine synthase
VSFYNETEGNAVYPTPSVGMVGILERDDAGRPLAFTDAALDILLLGETREELGGSEWQQLTMPEALAAPPRVDLAAEKRLVDVLLELDAYRLIRSAHDLANGGLAIALAECATSGTGCHVDLTGHADTLDALALLFSESQARAIVSCDPAHTPEALHRAEQRGVRAQRIGRTATATFLVERNGVPLLRTTTPELTRISRSAFALLLGGDTPDDVIRGVGEEADLIGH